MKTKAFILAFLTMGLLVLSACSPQAPSGAPTPGGGTNITLADQGKTISLAVGESFLLDLGEGYDWTVTVSDQSVIDRVKNIAVIVGAQGVYEALAPGTTTLSATGNPQCSATQMPCPDLAIAFSITVIVH
jgi:hypothetical protein